MTTPVQLRAPRPLTRSQELIWAGQRLHPDAPIANTGYLHRVRGPLDPGRLVAAFDQVVRAADALRTVVADVGGAPQRRVLAGPPATTSVIDLPADEVGSWAEHRMATPIPIDRCAYDSVLLRHGPDSWSWYLAIHHLVVDAWGAAIAFRATSDVYQGRTPELHPVADHHRRLDGLRSDVGWQRARERWAADRQPATTTRLYHDGPATSRSHRLPVPFDVGRREALDRLLAEDLRPLSHELGVLAVLATATACYVRRVSGRRQVVLGVPVHHRRLPAERATVGLLMELFPLTVDVDDDDTFRSLYQRTTRAVVDLLRWAQPGTSPRPHHDVVLNVITASSGRFADLPTTTTWLHPGHVDPGHRLRVQWFDPTGEGDVQLVLDLNEAAADADQRRWAPGHLSAVLDALVADPDTGVLGFPLVGPEERAALLAASTSDRPSAADGRTPGRDVVPALRAAGRSTALVDGDLELSGDEVATRIEDVARWLAARGIGPGAAVGIRLPRSADAVLALHGVLRAGAAFVPLDPAYPAAHLAALTEEADLDLVLDALPPAGPPGQPLPDPPGADDVAYLLFTSGSAGRPKAVPVTHRGLDEYLAFALDTYVEPGERPVVGLVSSLSFDLTITSLFLPFLAGGTMLVHRGDGPTALAALAADRRVTLLKATPSHLELLVRRLADGHPLRTLVVGGEAFPRALAVRLLEALPGARIFDEYGPTEAVVGCMVHRFDPTTDLGPDVPIGGPSPGVRLYVLDEGGHLAPRGVAGELVIARPGLATGYLGRAELTAERFTALPAVDEPHVYRSGDLVRFRDATRLDYLGRIDEQLKVGGVRLEPGDVEAALRRHPRIAAVAVRLWTSASGDRPVRRCVRCGLGTDVPGTELDDAGVCGACHRYDRVREQAAAYFGTEEDLRRARDRARARRRGRYDALHLLSGGKDSTYALYRLVELGFEVRAFTLDNGFISDEAKANVRRVVEDLGVDHEFATTSAMPEIFRDSLERYSNVCNGCYKAIYTLAVARARQLGIPTIVTGLSRGQFFETRLTPGQFAADRFDPAAIDHAVVEARKVYHRTADAVSRLLDVSAFDDDATFDEVEFLDFYRYDDTPLTDVLAFLDQRAPWVRPSDTGRSTNCLINAAGIHVHRLERGFHNYAIPYAWDVRVGHKTRDEALDELDDPVDDAEVERLLAAVGYRPRHRELLTAWYVVADGPGVPIDPDELRDLVAAHVPAHAVPSAYVLVDELPLSANGKLDAAALPPPDRRHREASSGYLPPVGPVEEALCELWAGVLGLDRVGAMDDFFDLGGSSLDAIELVLLVGETYGVTLDDDRIFVLRTVRELARHVQDLVEADIAALDDDDVAAQLGEG